MPTIDDLGPQLSIDYLKAIEHLEALQPLLRASPSIYVPAKNEVHSLQPWAFFQPPPNFLTGVKAVFTHEKIVPAVESIDEDAEKKRRFEEIPCDTEEEKEEKEKLKNLLFTLKNMSEMLRLIAEQTVQYSTGPLDVVKGSPEDEAKFHTLFENRKIAYSYVRRGKFRFSLPYLEAIVEADPTSLIDLKTLGEVYVYVYRPEDAIVYLRKSFDMDPEDATVQLNLARAYFETGSIEDGLRLCNALTHHPDTYVSQNASDLVELFSSQSEQTDYSQEFQQRYEENKKSAESQVVSSDAYDLN